MYINDDHTGAPLSFWFDRLCGAEREVVALTGCGGKTALLWHLAQCWRHKKTLAGVTTKFRCPPPESGLYDRRYDRAAALPRRAETGVSVAYHHDAQSGKDTGLLPEELAALLPLFERAVLECDGSRMLPLKGWAGYEPVIPPGVTLTCGILPLWTLGLPADERIVHRLPLFLEQAGLRAGDIIRPEHIARLISAPSGLFQKARGKRLLFFNQIETPAALENARRVAALLPPSFTETLAAILAASVHHDGARAVGLPGFKRGRILDAG